jgi:hypothetical protein
VEKMKKIIKILKRRNEDIDSKTKDEIEIMVGIMEQLYVSSAVGKK